MSVHIVRTILLLLCLPASVAAQGISVEETLELRSGDSIVALANDWVIASSFEVVDAEGVRLPDDLLKLDEVEGRIILDSALRDSIDRSPSPLRLIVRYRYLPIDPKKRSRRYTIVRDDDTTDSSGRLLAPTDPVPSSGLSATDIFGRDFRRSGSISRGLTLGSNRDLSLESSLRLEFSGIIAEDVEVVGALSDEQTPIQPEGTTRTLREVDNIFLEVRSPSVGGTIGKFFADDATTTEFLDFRRKVQGARIVGRIDSAASLQALVAISPGSYRTQEFLGREGDQGPYRLVAPSGETDIVVLAGTERVFVDGIEMIRGVDNDYIIDYAAAEITFRPRRPISAFNEIVVDFEYTTRSYSRSLLAGSGSIPLFDSTLAFSFGWMREADDPDAPLDREYDDDALALLAAAGEDPTAAAESGVRFVGRSDTGSGSYRRVDTIIDGISTEIYVYDPSSDEAVYDVSFSQAPDGRGDYRSVAFGRYEYVGPGEGTWLPVRYLPLPAGQQNGTLRLEWRPTGSTRLHTEVALSSLDRNRLSAIDSERTGLGLSSGIRTSFDSVRLGSTSIGRLSFDGSLRIVDGRYAPIGRISSTEFERQWNTGARTGESGFDDLIGEGRLGWEPTRRIRTEAAIGRLDRGEAFASTRQDYRFRYGAIDHPLSLESRLELIDSRDSIGGGRISDWRKIGSRVGYRIGRVTPAMAVRFEERDDRRDGVDTLLPGAFRFLEAGPDLLLDLPLFRTTLSGRMRFDDSVRFDPAVGETRYLDDSRTTTLGVSGRLTGVRNLRSSLDLSWRRRTFDSVPGAAARLDNSTILARSETSWTPFDRALSLDALYDVQTERAARLERIFVRVPIGQGTYIWNDLDGNGLQTEEEFRETIAADGEYVRLTLPTDELFPVVDLDADLALRLEPSRIVADSTTFGGILRSLSTETTLRLQEKSTIADESAIYQMNLSRFQSDSTISGSSLLGQDLHLFERDRTFNLRLRFQQRRGVSRLFNGLERSTAIERSIRANWEPVDDIALRLDVAFDDRSLLGDELDATRAYDLDLLRIESDFSYRPTRSLELGWIFRRRIADDRFPISGRATDLVGNEIRALYAIETKGRLRATLERTVVDGENVEGGDIFSLPFQLTDGYGVGTSWIGTLSFDYRIGANIQVSVSWTGRSEPPTGRVIHLGSSGVRAFF